MVAYGIACKRMNAGMILFTIRVHVTAWPLLGAFMAMIRQLELASNEAEAARQEREWLLGGLQTAHQ